MKFRRFTYLLPVLILAAAYAHAADWYVSSDASIDGDGTQSNPWQLQIALDHPASVKAGDTIWLRGGEYLTTTGFTSRLTGLPQSSIVVRPYPGEWAAITLNHNSGNGFTIIGAWSEFVNLEFRSTLTSRPANTGGLGFHGHDNKLINCIVHDTGNNAPHGNGNLIYGSLFYFNGGDGSGLGHAMYIQNEDPAKPAVFEDNIIFASYGFGVHAYAGGVGLLNGLRFIGNVSFINGTAQTDGNLKDNYLIGGVNGQRGTVLRENMGWSYSPNTRSVAIGRYSDTGNIDALLENNYLVGTTLFYNQWQSISMVGNTFYGPVTWEGSSLNSSHPDNNYLSAAPAQNRIFLRPNRYEAGRAHIVVYNWEGSSYALVDPAQVLPVNAAYEVRNAQNYFGAPVLSGIYNGGFLSIPLAGLPMATPVASGRIEESEKTGSAFNVFVLHQTGSPIPPTATAAPSPSLTPASMRGTCSIAVSQNCRKPVRKRTLCRFRTGIKLNRQGLPGVLHTLERKAGSSRFTSIKLLASGKGGFRGAALRVAGTAKYRAVFPSLSCTTSSLAVRVR